MYYVACGPLLVPKEHFGVALTSSEIAATPAIPSVAQCSATGSSRLQIVAFWGGTRQSQVIHNPEHLMLRLNYRMVQFSFVHPEQNDCNLIDLIQNNSNNLSYIILQNRHLRWCE